ncbi:MAG: DUF2889 domain-containing protein [Deltaproteobacteria bacterium]|nr:DUF2889 domain-containing protein [Deltaproteobacteria bacterium]MBT4090451.1 DUF2889 domain-containing protein [Deltaproteobacteria bacterium]MBT4263773.1 DUF2889 domain-containing protein [Deltaproteobacteria bacterium]MBT4643328.1 DUF2889 domain-containing protein [Deltaproteobacteria bacterium]MBT6498695.1 DUF2889 domain-containing protein [Deltaproteobacteria bacterium]
MTLRFLRNKVVEVETHSEGILVVSWQLTDDLQKAEVNLLFQLPQLEILEAKASIDRFVPQSCQSASELIKKVEGISVGSGMRKIVAGLLGGPDGCSLLEEAVLESANAVILNFTRPGIEIAESMTDDDEKLKLFQEMVKSSPRLVRSCISFQDDSPIMKELNL